MADVIKWDESCRVGVKEFDDAHKRLFEIGNRMIRAAVQEAGPETTRDIIGDLIDYADTHFKREEALMQETSYPDCEHHRNEHRRLLNDVLLFKSQYLARNLDSATIATFLIEWIVNHIKSTDMKYSAHFQAKGIC